MAYSPGMTVRSSFKTWVLWLILTPPFVMKHDSPNFTAQNVDFLMGWR